ncbi:Cyclin-dependent kinase [Bertholletia excelsa]
MAAGRHGVYRDNEFRDRESDLEVSRREISYSTREYDRTRNGDRDYEKARGRDRGIRDRVRVRQKDIKEREVVNGGNRSASSRSDSGSSSDRYRKQYGFSVRDAEREPGELSSESGSDEASDSGVQVKENESLKLENGVQSPVENKKRKFSPIVWDRDDKEVSDTSRIKNGMDDTALPPPPPLPKSYRLSPNVIPDAGIMISPLKDSDVHSSEASPDKPQDMYEAPVELASSPPEEQRGSNFQETEQLEDEDYIPTRNISASRWAGNANSPIDEGEISDNPEIPKRRKKMPISDSMLRGKSLTPESGELKREGSLGTRARSRSTESDEGGYRVRSSSRDDSVTDDADKNDYMEIDEEQDMKTDSNNQLDTESEDEHDSHGTPDPSGPPQRTVNMLQGCRSVDEFERLNKIDEGTYGVVYRARDKKTGEIVALKKVKMEKEREGFPLTSLREINILLSFHHPSIVDVKEVVVGSSLDSIFMVMEYMEHDLKGLMETMKQPFSQSEVKCLMLQLLEGIKYLHDNWVLHRDLKTSNLLLNNRGELKICDFGLARQYGSPLKPYTHLVVTLWYRAPELLLGAKQYSTAIDMWSLGCIMAELLSKQPLFNGKTEFDQLDKIFRILGTPNETIWPGFSKLPGVKVNFVKHQYNLLRRKFPATSFTGSPVLSDAGFDLLNKLLTYDPEKRITAEDALNHEWFREVPLPKSKEFMPTFPAQHAQDRRLRRIMKSPDPLEEQRRKELQQGELGTGGVFG